MTKPVEVADEFGVPWLVYDGDPAWKLVKQLKFLTVIHLQREALLTGNARKLDPPNWDGLDLTALTEATKEIIRRHQRLYDCHEVISSKS
jgi:hypothetical protein